MTAFAILLQVLGVLSGCVILHYSMQSIDSMSSKTHHGIRVAFIVMATGGFAQIIDPFVTKDVTTHGDLLLSCSLALLLLFDRRCVACPPAVGQAKKRKRDRRQLENGPEIIC